MSSLQYGAVAYERPGSDEPKPDKSPVDTTWMVLEAANDLGDHATVEVCRRIIDANLSGQVASQSDLQIVLDYFR
jgi:hypothetical protein